MKKREVKRSLKSSIEQRWLLFYGNNSIYHIIYFLWLLACLERFINFPWQQPKTKQKNVFPYQPNEILIKMRRFTLFVALFVFRCSPSLYYYFCIYSPHRTRYTQNNNTQSGYVLLQTLGPLRYLNNNGGFSF